MEENDWRELLAYILERLSVGGSFDIVDEAKVSASTRIIEKTALTKEIKKTLPQASSREVGDIATRLPTAHESFISAFNVIKTRLEVLPEIGAHLVRNLGVSAENIIWRSEISEYSPLTTGADFSASDIIVSSLDQQEIAKALNELENLVKHG